MAETKDLLNELFVDLFQHILNLEEKDLQKRGVDLTISEVHVLDAVKTTHPPTMTNIANDLMITIGSCTTAIKKLEAKGYVQREKQEKDGRIVYVYLNEKAEDALRVHYKYHSDMVDNIINELSDEEEQALYRAISKIIKYFNL